MILALALIFPTGLAAQTVISIDLGNNVFLGSSDVAGVVPVANWQEESGFPDFGPNGNLVDQNGDVVPGVTVSGDGNGNADSTVATTADVNTTMYDRLLRSSNTQGSVTISGLNVGSGGEFEFGYDVYLYFAPATSASGNTETLTISNGTTDYFGNLDTSADNYAGSFVRLDSTDNLNPSTNGNYALFEDMTASNFSITFLNASGAGNFGAAGIQIVANAIPEPSVSALLLGAVGVMGLARRRRRG